MLEVSEGFKKAIRGSKRQVKAKVEVYFSDIPTVFEDDDILSIDLVEESRADSDNPLGLVSSNEITISFDNSNRDFTPTNIDGKYSKYMRPNILIKPYLGVVLEDEIVEYVPLGVFKGMDWDTKSTDTQATVTGFDRIFEIAELEVPMLPVVYDTNSGDMFEMLFKSLGLSDDEFIIGGSVSLPIKNGWFRKGTVIQELQNLCRYSLCNVFADRYGRIVVKSNFDKEVDIATYTDDDMIISTQNPQRFLDSYSKVRTGYRVIYIKQLDALVEIKDLTVENGETIIENLEFSDFPCVQLNEVSLIGARNVDIVEYGYGANSMYIKLSNTGSAETVDIQAIGRTLGSHTSSKERVSSQAVERYGEIELTQFNHLMQDGQLAQLYSDTLLDYVSDPLLNFEIDFRGDPSIEIFDTVEIINNADKIGTVRIVPYRINLNYDGTLSGNMLGRKV